MSNELLGIEEHQMERNETNESKLGSEQDTIQQQKTDQYNLNHPLDKVIQQDKLIVEMQQTKAFVQNNFTTQQNIHLNNSIRFADTKAGVLSGANGFVFSYLLDKMNTFTGVSEVSIKVGIAFLIVSIFYSLWVVYPRFMNSKDQGLVYWEHITNYKKKEYVKAIMEDDTDELLRNSVENNYTQAIILTKKFKKLAIGFKFCIGGYILIAAGLLLKFI